MYALTEREVTTSTVAALLTILGYSLYDTIIVFDRIRENVPRMPRATFSQIANRSMSEVLTRSLATSFTVLLPVGALLLFGGETLKDFAFALLVGVASGTYSSIFIATPVLVEWKEREPVYMRRRRLVMEEHGGLVPAFATGALAAEPRRGRRDRGRTARGARAAARRRRDAARRRRAQGAAAADRRRRRTAAAAERRRAAAARSRPRRAAERRAPAARRAAAEPPARPRRAAARRAARRAAAPPAPSRGRRRPTEPARRRPAPSERRTAGPTAGAGRPKPKPKRQRPRKKHGRR